jgi:hypothetical protein
MVQQVSGHDLAQRVGQAVSVRAAYLAIYRKKTRKLSVALLCPYDKRVQSKSIK